MKTILAIIITILMAAKGFSQTPETSVMGRVIQANNTPVEAATVSLLNKKDSSLVKMVITDKAGKFSFKNIAYGSYLLQASTINFNSSYSTVFAVDNVLLDK